MITIKKFIIITGPMGVGKTTIGKGLCDKLGRTAFIDGDWCLDIHPFVGNKETKNMAIDNILHLVKNYYLCSECDTIVLSWVMSENTISKIVSGLENLHMEIFNVTLICNEKALRVRWENDTITEWRNNDELKNSLESLDDYSSRTKSNLIDTSNISADRVIGMIIEIVHTK